MKNNLHTLLAGPLYINEMYGVSLIPSIYNSFKNNDLVEKKVEDLMRECQTANENTSINSTANKVVVVDFLQPVIKFDYCYWLGTKTYTKILRQLENDDTVAGVVLNIDSGGGQVYGTPEFYDIIKNYSKPLVSYTDGYMCSGAYYLGAGTKRIFANKRADAIGSIGAYSTIVDGNGIIEHFGGKVHTIYATKSTEKNSEYREVIDNANYEPYIKNQLDPIVDAFISDMKEARPNLKEEVFKGGTWIGSKALKMGLVDQLGTIQDAINYVFELSKNSNSNTNSNMSKSRPLVEAVLGLDAPLASSDKGSYLNEEQLNTIENRLGELEKTASNLQTQLDDANANHQNALDAVNTKLTDATNNASAVETSVDAALTSLGLPVEGTITEKLTALNDKAVVLGKKDGATHTSVKTDGKTIDNKHDFVDPNASHNKLANSLNT